MKMGSDTGFIVQGQTIQPKDALPSKKILVPLEVLNAWFLHLNTNLKEITAVIKKATGSSSELSVRDVGIMTTVVAWYYGSEVGKGYTRKLRSDENASHYDPEEYWVKENQATGASSLLNRLTNPGVRSATRKKVRTGPKDNEPSNHDHLVAYAMVKYFKEKESGKKFLLAL